MNFVLDFFSGTGNFKRSKKAIETVFPFVFLTRNFAGLLVLNNCKAVQN
ncbi:hypothetical protein A5875_002770, partial [Enterococcus sp. 3H8_DIV0648]